MKTTKSMIRCGGMLTILVLALGLTAKVANADFTFGIPTNLGPPVNSTYSEASPSISADGLQLYFFDFPDPFPTRPGGYGLRDIWVATRATKDDPWGEPVNPGPPINSSSHDTMPCISADGLSLYFSSTRPGGSGSFDLWVATRPTVSDPWGTLVNLGPTVNSSGMDRGPNISADGLSLFFNSNRPGGSGDDDIWVTTRDTIDDDWGAPVNLGPIVNGPTNDYGPDISADGLWLFFFTSGEYYSIFDLWATTRDTIDHEWGTPVKLGPTVNSSASDMTPNISADGSTLYFSSNRFGGLGNLDLWQVSIEPIVDFNGDEIVDIEDLIMLIEHWGENYSLCDIGPTPLGDGIVDVQDLEVLMSYWQQEVLPVELVAYWKLDEIEGDIAYDSVAANDGVVIGDAIWQPDTGKVNGALQFDGIDDYVSTPFILDPEDGAFSVFTWIKGGAAGQVIISQTDDSFGGSGETWVGTEPSNGNFMTGLMLPPLGRNVPLPLVSESIITDGHWHHIGLVWDSSYRYLYVDGIEVAKDTKALNSLTASIGGLFIGAGKTLDAGSFFSGLIDDVRIYNQALSAEKIEALAQ